MINENITLIDPGVALELLEGIQRGKINLEGVNIIISALNKDDIKATYEVNKSIEVVKAGGAIYTEYLQEKENKSYINVLINDFNSIKIKYGENEAIKNLKRLTQPVKRYKNTKKY